MSTTGPGKPSSRTVAAALPPARPPPTITIGFPLVRSATQYILPVDRETQAAVVGDDQRPVYRPAQHVPDHLAHGRPVAPGGLRRLIPAAAAAAASVGTAAGGRARTR